jgi:FAD-dependent urate hydroxylase
VVDVHDVAVVGAGPQGLAVAAHLRAAGCELAVFGEPLGFWKHHMPDRMMLRSMPRASSISEPDRALTFPRFAVEHGVTDVPIPIDEFVRYGESFQKTLVPDLDRRAVSEIRPLDHGFVLLLDDGADVTARRVVVAAGVAGFSFIPPRFRALPPSLVTHTFDHTSFDRFAGRRVVVVGGGQSALESAALLHEAAADIEVLVRRPSVRWLRELPADDHTTLAQRFHDVVTPPTGVGPPGLNWVVGVPELFRSLPPELRGYVSRRAIPPAGADWLRRRLDTVPIRTGRRVTAAAKTATGVRLSLDDGTERAADHVLLATGYAPDVGRYPFLAPELRQRITTAAGYPVLGPGFESSVPGLHFVGAPAAHSYGPIMRFVVGSAYTAPVVAARVTGERTPMLLHAW